MAAKLMTAVGSYAEMPPVALLVQYLPEAERRNFVESMALVKVKQGECIMRQGATVHAPSSQLSAPRPLLRAAG
jgi:hypothetical protein